MAASMLQEIGRVGLVSPIEIAFVTACTALVSSFVAPVITLRMARAQIRASVVSNNRQRWVESLRDLISAFCAEAIVAAPMRSRIFGDSGILPSIDPAVLERIEQIIKTFTKIRLMLNPVEVDHQELVAVLIQIVSILRNSPVDAALDSKMDELIEKVV